MIMLLFKIYTPSVICVYGSYMNSLAYFKSLMLKPDKVHLESLKTKWDVFTGFYFLGP